MSGGKREVSVDVPLLDRLRSKRPHLHVTWLLITLNLLVFCTMLFYGAGLWHSPNTVQLAWGANFGPATKDGEWWRLGSALFLHFGLFHLAMNMFALWEGGSFVERMFGPWRFLLIYAAGGLLGNLLSLIMQGDHAIAGGASGAVFGIYGALLVYLWAQRRQLNPIEFRWLFWGACAFSAITILMGLLIPGIDNAAHIGGFLGGVSAGLVLRPPVPVADGITPDTRWIAAIVLTAAFAGLFFSVPAPSYHWHKELEAQQRVSQIVNDERQINSSWDSILRQGLNGGSFEDMATRVDAEIGNQYEQTFEQLSSLQIDPSSPSAITLDKLRRYVEVRRDASHQLAEGLRNHDKGQIESALFQARNAGQVSVKPKSAEDLKRQQR